MYDEHSWRKGHSHHHKIHGNKYEYDETKTVINVKDYHNLNFFKKSVYIIIRTPIFFFILIPLYMFFVYRLISPLHTLKIIVFFYIIFKIGKIDLIKKILIGQLLAGIIGTMLFHLQHQVNTSYWKTFNKKDKLSHDRAQLHGASILCVPNYLKWITLGIEYHHIHHLTPRIPCYNLQKCHEYNEHLLNKITKVGYEQAFKSLFHTLYDENEKKYLSFDIDRFRGLQG